ncbi:hypothetical protein ACFQI7_32490 [Paenibacillus allorhizosphaerae]|uniref:GIY-YIG nuclease family protein n=1 Tax=Paenibacillus allorhizosphaerae TaxID=2849866 RepID=A0ABM8VTY2_9BACL|nr:hypothetical protein [Paenibacillus allorhizosphaerae]CAG7658370.1 hypothetical protein PAECIP111802_07024 [Paenibacillus allorhizosphaerae]
MIDLTSWFRSNSGHSLTPLFETIDGLQVETKIKTVKDKERRLLKRSKLMENAVIETIESNLSDPQWEGIIYVMGREKGADIIPLYIGKADKKGIKHDISANIRNIRRNQHMFARWGDGLAYHIGDLSQALFGFGGYQKPQQKYKRWAEALFQSYDPPILKSPICFYITPWFEGQLGLSGLPCSLPAVEKEIIAIASAQFGETLLNKDGI